MKKAIIVVGNGYTDSEFIYAYHRLLEDQFEVDVCTLDGRDAVGEKGVVAMATMSTKDIKIGRVLPWDMVIIVGGVKNIERTRQDKATVALVRLAFDQGKVLGLICWGASLAIEADIVRGRKITGYYSFRKDLENAGGQYIDAPVVVDGRMITSPHYDFNHDFMRAVLKAYYGMI